MKIQISRDSHHPSKDYSGVLQQQGRMLTDADWNELQAIIGDKLAAALQDIVGDGVSKANPQRIYAGGLAGAVASADLIQAYSAQAKDGGAFPAAPGPLLDGEVLYADIWERTVLYLEDERLRDAGLHGADTCARTQRMVQIKRAPTDAVETIPPRGDATLSVELTGSKADLTTDDPCADSAAIDQPIQNFLFRVEVHDVIDTSDLNGAPTSTSVTLKWSSENGAEAYATKDRDQAPEDFKKADYLYEFYNLETEKQLGVHRVKDFHPARGLREEGFPSSPPAYPYVRRWDGHATLVLTTSGIAGPVWRVKEGWHRGQKLAAATLPAGAPWVAEINDLQLTLDINGKNFVAGDYWMVAVRTADATGTKLLDKETPAGIQHRYVKLGTVATGTLDPVPPFPSLSSIPAQFVEMQQTLDTLRNQLDATQLQLTEHIKALENAHQASAIGAVPDEAYLPGAENVQTQLTGIIAKVKASALVGHNHDERYLWCYHSDSYPLKRLILSGDAYVQTKVPLVGVPSDRRPEIVSIQPYIATDKHLESEWQLSGPIVAKITVSVTKSLADDQYTFIAVNNTFEDLRVRISFYTTKDST